MHEDDDEWRAAEEALAQARSMPAGAARIEALRRAGKLRFAADRKLHKDEEGTPGYPSKYGRQTK